MAQALADERVPLIYLPKFREWGLRIDGPVLQEVTHCPWCGSELSGSLRDRYFDTLEARGIDPAGPDVPLHFRTDAWWQLDDS